MGSGTQKGIRKLLTGVIGKRAWGQGAVWLFSVVIWWIPSDGDQPSPPICHLTKTREGDFISKPEPHICRNPQTQASSVLWVIVITRLRWQHLIMCAALSPASSKVILTAWLGYWDRYYLRFQKRKSRPCTADSLRARTGIHVPSPVVTKPVLLPLPLCTSHSAMR